MFVSGFTINSEKPKTIFTSMFPFNAKQNIGGSHHGDSHHGGVSPFCVVMLGISTDVYLRCLLLAWSHVARSS